ncbi:MAG: signal peptidase I [Chloroflexota bacterium]|nr:signal peptidase I [Chloroflexota bacterium]
MDDSEHVSEAVVPGPTPAFRSDSLQPAKSAAKNRGAFREIVETLILTALIFFGVRVLVQNYKVEGYSMEPTLQDSQYLIVNKVGLHFSQLQRGDIIVFRYPLDPTKSFVKRVIALPGDSVEVRDGKVSVDGQVLKEPYLNAPTRGYFPRTVVPAGDYFVLGDNRNNSSDSRAWGPLPANDVIGRAWVSYWPPNEWGVVREFRYAKLPPQ